VWSAAMSSEKNKSNSGTAQSSSYGGGDQFGQQVLNYTFTEFLQMSGYDLIYPDFLTSDDLNFEPPSMKAIFHRLTKRKKFSNRSNFFIFVLFFNS
jgi:hypothetical protein